MNTTDIFLNVSDKIRRKIEENINNGIYLPGDSLDESEIAREFDVSRTPVREAILQLSAHGLVTVVPRSGTYVARMSIKELLAVFELLAELEGVCAKLAARRMDAKARSRLQRLHEESHSLLAAHDAMGYEQANANFHGVLYEGCLNAYLREQILTIRLRTRAYRQDHFQDPRRVRKSWQDHAVVVEAILAGDDTAASLAMIDHIAIGGKEFAEFITRIPDRLLSA